MKCFKDNLGKIVVLTVKKDSYGSFEHVKYKGVILPMFTTINDDFISEEYFSIYDLNINNEVKFKAVNVVSISEGYVNENKKELLLEIYKLACEDINLEKESYLLDTKRSLNKERLSSCSAQLKALDDRMTFPDFKNHLKDALNGMIKEGKLPSNIEIDCYYMLGDYNVQFSGSMNQIKTLKLTRSEDIEKYAHKAGYPFISTYEEYDGEMCANIDYNDKSYKAMLKDYKKDDITIYKNKDVEIEEESYLSLGDKYWLRYNHKIKINFLKPLDLEIESIDKILNVFKK